MQENPGVGGHTSTYNKLFAAGDASGAPEDPGKETPIQSATRDGEDVDAERRDTRPCRVHQSDPRRSDRTATERSGSQDFEKLHDIINTGQDTLMNGHKLSAKLTNLKIAPTAQSSSPKITQDVPKYTRTTDYEHKRGEEGPIGRHSIGGRIRRNP